MLEFRNPIPVIVENDKEGYAIYVTNSGTFENDVWCVALCEGGHIRHYTSDQVKMYVNATFDIKKDSHGRPDSEKRGGEVPTKKFGGY